MYKNILIVIGFVFPVMNAAAGPASLCRKNETIYFSCATNSGKIISLCGDAFYQDEFGSLTEIDNPWLQYRFGSPGKIELSYPPQKNDSLKRFASDKIRALRGEIRLDAVFFANAGIAYSVEHVVPDTGEIFEGVHVGAAQDFGIETAGKRRKQYPRAAIECKESANVENFFSLVDFLAK
ncbi:hypothetical protein [Collimonas fungivorans]|uniref:hypothetical protein n=1 Tax=Collimonas fungivorans TaxID=158899 RepID=UPI0007788156|nr:hypothetical protein [Collimonas fungivorans]